MSGAIFQTFLGVAGDLREKGMTSTNYLVFDDYDIQGQYEGGRTDDGLYLPRNCFITSATIKDPDHALHHAPKSVTSVEVMAPVPPIGAIWGVADAVSWGYKKDDTYRRQKIAIEQSLISRLDALFPGSASSIVFRESSTPMTHQRFTRASAGAAYGLAASVSQFLERRPRARTPLAGLYLTGASTGVGPGMVGAMLNGRQAARAIGEDFGRPFEITP
jgi:phytoene dehydrogenase-like protein